MDDFWEWQLRRRIGYTVWGDYLRLVQQGLIKPPTVTKWAHLRKFAASYDKPIDPAELRSAWARYYAAIAASRRRATNANAHRADAIEK